MVLETYMTVHLKFLQHGLNNIVSVHTLVCEVDPPAVKQTALSLSQQWKAPRVVKEANALGHPFGSHQGALELAHFCHVLCLRRRKILDMYHLR